MNLIAKDIKDTNISTSNLHLFDMLDLLVKKYNYKYIDINLLYEKDIDQKLIELYGELPKNIFLIKGSSGIQKFKTRVDISFLIDDVHPGGSVRKNRQRSLKKTKNVFCTYAYAFNKYYKKGKYNLYWLPHSLRYHDIKYNTDPIEKILITGRLNKRVYPNRQIIYDMSKSNKNIVYLKPNVGYRVKEDNKNLIYGKRFMNYLNKYLCGFTCDLISERPYIVAKHFEIMGSGALLLACNPNTKDKFKELGFIDMEHYISCTPENIKEKINFILSNRDLIDKIRRKGYDLVTKEHIYEKRTEFLNSILSS